MPDLNPREYVSLGAIALVVMWMGIYPESFLAPMRSDVGLLMARVASAAPKSDSALVTPALAAPANQISTAAGGAH